MIHPHKRHLLREGYETYVATGGQTVQPLGTIGATLKVTADTPTPLKSRLQALLSRKWLFAMTALLGLFRAVQMKSISEGVFQVLLLALIGAYLAANVLQKKTTATIGAKA